MPKTKKEYLKDYQTAMIEISEGFLSNKNFKHLNKTLTVGDLKNMLKNFDDNMPIIVESFEDPLTSISQPLRRLSEIQEYGDTVDSNFLVLSSVDDKDYEEWYYQVEGHLEDDDYD